MKSCLFIVLALVAITQASLTGTSLYKSLIREWSYAYDVASGVSIEYNLTTVEGEYPGTNLITDLNIPTVNLTENTYIVPIVGYPIALVYNIPFLNQTLVMTRDLLAYIITNNSIAWNDPLILELNPGLENTGTAVRMIFNSIADTTNQFIIDYLFDNMTDQGGSWQGLAAPRYVRAPGFSTVVADVSGFGDSMALVPLPYIAESTSTTLALGLLQLSNGTLVSPLEPPFVNLNGNFSVLSASSSEPWPMISYCYMVFDQTQDSCAIPIEITRFLYWTFGNAELYNQTGTHGFYVFDDQDFKTLESHLFNAECNGNKVLTYTNIEPTTRTNVVFGVTTPLMILFLVLVLASWLVRDDRFQGLVILNNAVVVLGLLLSFISFVLWWYPPSNSGICIARFWLFGLGFVNVVAAVYIYVVSIDAILSKQVLSAIMFSKQKFVLAYLVLEGLELAILLLWVFIEKPVGKAVVLNQLEWLTIYECKVQYGVLDIIQVLYFCLICLFGCYFIYKHWDPKKIEGEDIKIVKKMLEDTKWHLMALSGELGLFVIYLVITRIVNFTDDDLYSITVPIFTFLVGNITVAFFLPRLWGMIKQTRNLSSSSSKVKGMSKQDSDEKKGFRISRSNTMEMSATDYGTELPKLEV
jgi:hypothetical protein